jgi:hypothetical protein
MDAREENKSDQSFLHQSVHEIDLSKSRTEFYAGSPIETRTDGRSKSAGLLVFFLCLIVATFGLFYERSARTLTTNSLRQTNGINEQSEGGNRDLIDLVRKAPSKSPGSTVSQSLMSYLNGKNGPNWQSVGWKYEASNYQKNRATIKFSWTEQDINKEAEWEIELTTKNIVAINETAKLIGP